METSGLLRYDMRKRDRYDLKDIMEIASFIIHMDGSVQRAPNVAKLLEILPNAQVISAIDGRKLSIEKRAAVTREIHLQPAYPFPLSAAEIGCFLSHRKCWQKIVEGKLPFAFIAEDDLIVDPQSFTNAMDLAIRHANSDSYIRFPTKNREVPAKNLDANNRQKLFIPQVTGLQATIQLVGKNVAKRLLELTEQIDRPVDTFVQMTWLTDVQPSVVYPNGISVLAVESTIQKKLPLHAKLHREWDRGWYRYQIRKFSAQRIIK